MSARPESSLSPRHIKPFATVVQYGSVGQAARVLQRAQSAITRSVRALEGELATQLFERHPGGMRLTPAGQILMDHAERAFGEMEAAGFAFAMDRSAGNWVRTAPVFTLSLSRNRLLAFTELAEQHNMAAVALRLGISQPAVSQSVREIEAGLGISLFNRSTAIMRPTPLGALLALQTRRALAELWVAAEEVRKAGAPPLDPIQGRAMKILNL